MQFIKKNPPRTFSVGVNNSITISDCGRISLSADEQVTFITANGKEYDFAAKSWGFYATPSVNSRLVKQGFKTALVRNTAGQHYVMVVDDDHVGDFQKYLKDEKQQLVEWLDQRC